MLDGFAIVQEASRGASMTIIDGVGKREEWEKGIRFEDPLWSVFSADVGWAEREF